MHCTNRRMQPGTVKYLSPMTDRSPVYLLIRLLFFWMISSSALQAHGHFMYDSKAVLNDCQDYWTFRDRERIPLLFQVTVCVDIRVISPGSWLAFSYSSPHVPRYDLALEGDTGTLYAWLLGVRHRFPVSLSLGVWHRLCLRRDSLRNTFSLEVDGKSDSEHQRTVIARLIPPNGELALGCRPWDSDPGDGASRGKVELYLFRMWGDVEQHQACEDGSVAGWESWMWEVTRPRARVRDDHLYCAPTGDSKGFGSTPAPDTGQGTKGFSSTPVPPATTSYKSTTRPPSLTTPTGTTSTSQTTHITTSTVAAAARPTTASTLALTSESLSEKTTVPLTTGQRTQSLPMGPGGMSTSSIVSATFDPEKATTMAFTTSPVRAADPTPMTIESTQSSTFSTTKPFSGTTSSTTTLTTISSSPASLTTTLTTASSSPASLTTTLTTISSSSASMATTLTTASSSPASLTTTPTTTSSSTPTNSTATLTTTRTQLTNHSTAGQIVLQCNFSQFCTSSTSHYWMLVTVNVTGQQKTEVDIKNWLENAISHVESTEINCTDKVNIRMTNCTVQLQLSKPVNACDLRHKLHGEGSGSGIRATVRGNVERVGKGLCADEHLLTPEGDFVRCTYPEPYSGMCNSSQAVNVTCSYMDSDYVPATSPDSEPESCTFDQQTQCNCTSFCSDADAYYYALRLSIHSHTIKLEDIQKLIITNRSDCSAREQAVCKNITQAFRHFRKIHLECHGTDTRLHSCMVALMLDKQLDVCEVSRVMGYRLQGSNDVYYDGQLSRMAICGGSKSPNVTLLDSTLTWFSSSLSVPEFCDAVNSSSLTCKQDETKAVLLSDVCAEDQWSRDSGNLMLPTMAHPTDYSTSTVPVTTGTLQTSTQYTTSPALLNTTHSSITTQFNTTRLPLTSLSSTPLTPSNSTEVNGTALQQNSTQFYTTTLTPNSTQFKPTDLPLTQQSNTSLTPSNNTEFYGTLQQNSTQFYTTILPLNSTQFNTTSVPPSTKQFNMSTQNSTLFNSTTALWNNTQFNTTTPFPVNTTQMYTSVNESLHNQTSQNTTAVPTNVTHSATTSTSQNLTDFTTAAVSPNLTTSESFSPLPSYPNATVDYNGTASPLTTNTSSLNTSSSPTTSGVSSANTTASLPLNVTSSYTAAPVLNQTLATVTTPEQNVSLVSINPNTTSTTTTTATTTLTTLATTTLATTLTTLPQAGPQPTRVPPVSPNATASVVGASTLATTTTSTSTSKSTTTTTTSTKATTMPSNQVGLTSLATGTTVTTTPAPTTPSSPSEQANQLVNQTKDVSKLNSSQVAEVVKQLENILSGPNVSLEAGKAVLSVISNLLNASIDALGSSSNSLIKAVDTLALKLVVEEDSVLIATSSLALSVAKLDGPFSGGTFIIATQSAGNAGRGVRRSRRRRRRSSEGESMLGENDLGMVTLPSKLTENLSPEEQSYFSRVQFNFYSKATFFQDKALDQLLLNSGILGASASNLSISNLTEEVEIILRNDEPIPENATAVCVFWDFSKNGDSGGWSQEGCSVHQNSTKNETICSCNHLTSFAVLMDLSRGGITDRLHATILSFITYIGCGISSIFLAMTLLTYIAFEKIRRDIPSKILIQLCLALLLLNLVFLLDSWLALYREAVGLCISTAFFLHYFLLASFTWMGLEALHMYLAIVKVFNNYMTRYMLKFSLMGWGLPLPIVIIVISVDKNNYGLVNYGKYSDGTTDDFCWFKNDIAFYVGVVAYFCAMFALNLVMFVVVMVQLHRVKRQNPHNNQHRSHLHDLRSVAGLTFLLGLTWGFAFFAWGPVNLAFMYLFAIFNSLQGFFIFVFHCALKDNVRRQWRIYLCCGRLRLAENSDWSRTATQNNTKKSSLVTTSSVHSSNSGLTQRASRNSSVTGDVLEHSNGIRSPFEDSVITALEDTNGDVVLNDINHPYSSRRQQ